MSKFQFWHKGMRKRKPLVRECQKNTVKVWCLENGCWCYPEYTYFSDDNLWQYKEKK